MTPCWSSRTDPRPHGPPRSFHVAPVRTHRLVLPSRSGLISMRRAGAPLVRDAPATMLNSRAALGLSGAVAGTEVATSGRNASSQWPLGACRCAAARAARTTAATCLQLWPIGQLQRPPKRGTRWVSSYTSTIVW